MTRAKADFTASVKAKTIASQITEATQEAQEPQKTRRTYTEQETLEAQEALKTQGRKGVSAPRINLAFTPSVYDYIKTMAGARGQSLTEFVNDILQKSMEDNRELYEQAQAFRNQFK